MRYCKLFIQLLDKMSSESDAECFITGSEPAHCIAIKRDIGTSMTGTGTSMTGTAMETDDDVICSATEVATQTAPLTAVDAATQTVARLITTPLPIPCKGVYTGDRTTQTESDAATAETPNISVKVYVSH